MYREKTERHTDRDREIQLPIFAGQNAKPAKTNRQPAHQHTNSEKHFCRQYQKSVYCVLTESTTLEFKGGGLSHLISVHTNLLPCENMTTMLFIHVGEWLAMEVGPSQF